MFEALSDALTGTLDALPGLHDGPHEAEFAEDEQFGKADIAYQRTCVIDENGDRYDMINAPSKIIVCELFSQ